MNDHDLDPLRNVLGRMYDKYHAMGDRTAGQNLHGFGGMGLHQGHGHVDNGSSDLGFKPFGDKSRDDLGPRGGFLGGPTIR